MRILLVDEQRAFYEWFKDKLQGLSVKTELTWVVGPGDIPDEVFDVYFVENKPNGANRDSEIVAKIKEKNADACICISSDCADLALLKSLLKEKVCAFVDKNESCFDDIELILHQADRFITMKRRLTTKLDILNDAIAACAGKGESSC